MSLNPYNLNYYPDKYIFRPFYKLMRGKINLPSYTSIAITRTLGYASHTVLAGIFFTNSSDSLKTKLITGAILSTPWAISGIRNYITEKKKPYNQKKSSTLEKIIYE